MFVLPFFGFLSPPPSLSLNARQRTVHPDGDPFDAPARQSARVEPRLPSSCHFFLGSFSMPLLLLQSMFFPSSTKDEKSVVVDFVSLFLLSTSIEKN